MRVLLKINGEPEAWFLADLRAEAGRGRVRRHIEAGRYAEAIILTLAGADPVRPVDACAAGACEADVMLSESGACWNCTGSR